MKFFSIETCGDLDDDRLCLVTRFPDGMDGCDFKLMFGRTVADEYPADAVVVMDAEYPGEVVSDFVGNTINCLIVTEKVKAIIDSLDAELELEWLPVELHRHDGTPHGAKLYFLNPIGAFDCLDFERSEVIIKKNGKARAKRCVLDPAKTERAPMLFRVPEKRSTHVIDERLKSRLEHSGVSNLVLHELPTA